MQKAIKAPFIKTDERIWSISADIIIVCIVMLAQSFFNFGYGSLITTAICTVLTVGIEFIAAKIIKIPSTISDLSGIKSGLLLSMLLSPSSPWWFAAMAGAICGLVRCCYIKKTSMPIIPPAVAACLLTVFFPGIMFGYTSPSGLFSVFAEQGLDTAAKSSAQWLMEGSVSPYSYFEIFLGVDPGPLGASLIALCLCGLVYLSLRKSINTIAVLTFIAECAIMAGAFPRGDYSAFESIVSELTSGSLIFCGIFFIGDKYTSPKHAIPSAIYGIVAATLCMLARYIGLYEQTAWFIVVLMCLISPLLEDVIWKIFKA